MTRTTVTIDRLATLLMAAVLAVIGLLALDWQFGWLLDLPARTSADVPLDLSAQAWWPWASGAIGVVLVLIGLRWLVSHLRSARVSQLNLRGTSSDGRLRVSTKATAAAAAGVLADHPGVRSARGKVNRDRGQLVVDLRASLTPDADLRELAAVCDTIAADLARVLERSDLYCRVHLNVSTSGAAASRVH